jgi:predicted HicB family RNase H-like nuclease
MSEVKVTENKISVRMPVELHLRLKLIAVRERKSVQEIINGLVAAYVDRKETESRE